jgi:hypothetical protein
VNRSLLTLRGDRREGHRSLTVEIPPAAESQFLFRRAFLNAIRLAINEAQIAGTIDAPTAVECFKALPIMEPDR